VRIRARILLALCGILVGLLLAEIVVRIAAPQELVVPWNDDINGVANILPNTRGRIAMPGAFDTTISVNSQRFRGRKEFQSEPNPGVIRLVMLGDSFTFGWGANDEESYPAQLEQILGDSLGPGRVEVINAGVPGIGTGEEAFYYEVWVKRFHPHVVVLGVYSNDVDDDLARSPFSLDESGRVSLRPTQEVAPAARRLHTIRRAVYALPGVSWLFQHSQVVNLMRMMLWMGTKSSAEGASTTRPIPSQIEGVRERYHEKGLPLMMGEVVWLNERVQGSGAKLVVVFLPPRAAVYPSSELQADDMPWKSQAIAASLNEVCSEHGIAFADLTPQVREQAGRLLQPLYYHVGQRDRHPNPEGYRVLANGVAGFLIRTGIVSNK
jgi:lysophospholipase L1-like esterase